MRALKSISLLRSKKSTLNPPPACTCLQVRSAEGDAGTLAEPRRPLRAQWGLITCHCGLLSTPSPHCFSSAEEEENDTLLLAWLCCAFFCQEHGRVIVAQHCAFHLSHGKWRGSSNWCRQTNYSAHPGAVRAVELEAFQITFMFLSKHTSCC